MEPRRSLGHVGQGSRAVSQLPGVGLRHLLGIHGAIHEGAGAPVPAEGRPSDLGGSGGSDADGRYRLPHALRMAAPHGATRRPRPGLGRSRGVGIPRDPAGHHSGWPRGRGDRLSGEGRVLPVARRGRFHQPEGLRPLGRAPQVGCARMEGVAGGCEGVREGHLGGSGGEDQPADRLRASRGGHDPHVELRVRPGRDDRDLRGNVGI